MLLKLVFCLYFLLYFVNGLTTHTRYSDKENVMDSMHKQQGNDRNASNLQDVILPKNEQPNKTVGKSNDQKLSNNQPSNDIGQLDQNFPNIKEPNNKPSPNADSKGQYSNESNKNQGLSNGQRLPDSKEQNKKLNNQIIQSEEQKARGKEETTKRQSKKNQSPGNYQKMHGVKEPTNKQSNINQSQDIGQKMPGANELSNKQFNTNQSQVSVQKTPVVNETTNKQSTIYQSHVGGQKLLGANEPTNMQSNKNQSRGSGGQKLPDVKEPIKNQGKPSVPKLPEVNQPIQNEEKPGGQKLPEFKQPSQNLEKPEGKKPGGQKLPEFKPPSLNQEKPEGQKPGGQKLPEFKPPSLNQEKPEGQKLPNVKQPSNNEGRPGGQKLPEIKQLSKNQEKPEGQKLPNVKQPSNNEGRPGGQKLPEVKQPSKSQETPEGQKLPNVKQPSKNEGRPGGQKLPDIKKPSKNEGETSVKKVPDVKQPSKNEEKPSVQTVPDIKEPSKNQEKLGGQKLPTVKEPSKNQDMALQNDSCPSNKSLHSRNDIIVMINYVYKQLSIDENIREAYQSHAMSLRDKHFKELNKFNTWFQNQPEHLKHVLQSLGSIRKQLIEPNVKKIAKLLHDNSDMDKIIDAKKERLRLLTKKLNRYERLCSLNCEEGEERFVVKRNVQDDYFCSSIEDLYNKINKRLSEFVQRFNNESNNRFAKDNDIYHKKIENIKNILKDKGLQMFGRTMYDILHLQDEYHHFVEHLNISSLEKEINLAKNLSIQVEAKLLELNEQIEKYGQHCRSCARGSSRRNIREAMEKMDSKQVRKNSETLVDLLIDNKFNETALRVHNDWDAIFKGLNQLITKTENENPRLGKFNSIKIKVIKMTANERKVLNKLKSTTSDMGIQKTTEWVKILRKLLKIIIEIIKYILKLNNGH